MSGSVGAIGRARWLHVSFRATHARHLERVVARQSYGGNHWRKYRRAVCSCGPLDAASVDISAAGREAVGVETLDNTSSTEHVAPRSAFAKLGMNMLLQRGLRALRVHVPTDIQSMSIPAVLERRSIVLQSHTGSGKTLAYLIPALTKGLQQLEEEAGVLGGNGSTPRKKIQARAPTSIVVAPSQELAMQIFRVAQELLGPELKAAVIQCIGGANAIRQRDAFKRCPNPMLVVGTPGRLAEFSRSGILRSHSTSLLVLDEWDELLSQQSRGAMLRLTEHIGISAPEGRQTVLVSATLRPAVLERAVTEWRLGPRAPEVLRPMHRQLSKEPQLEGGVDELVGGQQGTSTQSTAVGHTSNPQDISAASNSEGDSEDHITLPRTLRHLAVGSSPHRATDTLRRALHALEAQRALVFMNQQSHLRDAELKLAARHMPAASLHAGLSRMARRNILEGFRSGKFRALLVTDLAARGIDVPDCDMVVNLETPDDATQYAHRAGRTGRAGRPGTVLSIVSGGHIFATRRMSKKLGLELEEVEFRHGLPRPVDLEAQLNDHTSKQASERKQN